MLTGQCLVLPVITVNCKVVRFWTDNHFKSSTICSVYVRMCIYHIILQALGNDLQVTKSGVEEFLPAATVMVVSVTASTTQGLVLSYTYV